MDHGISEADPDGEPLSMRDKSNIGPDCLSKMVPADRASRASNPRKGTLLAFNPARARTRRERNLPIEGAAVESTGIELLPAPTSPNAQRESFVRRMKRVLLLRFYTDALLSGSDRRLLDHAIFSTFCDCQALGAGGEARRLLREARAGQGLFRKPVTAAR